MRVTHFWLCLLETHVWCHRQCPSSISIAARGPWRLCILSPAFAALIGFANIVYPYLPNSRFSDSPQSSHWLENWEGSILRVSVVCLIVKLAPLLMLLFGLSEEILSTFWGLFDDILMNFWGLYENVLWTFWGLFEYYLRTFWGLSGDLLRTFGGLSGNFCYFLLLSGSVWYFLVLSGNLIYFFSLFSSTFWYFLVISDTFFLVFSSTFW